MSAVTHSAGERSWDKGLFKNRVDDGEDRMVEDAVAHQGLVDMPLLRILDIEAFVRTMLVGSVFQFTVKPENILFKMPFKAKDVGLVPLITPKSIPSGKKIFR